MGKTQTLNSLVDGKRSVSDIRTYFIKIVIITVTTLLIIS